MHPFRDRGGLVAALPRRAAPQRPPPPPSDAASSPSRPSNPGASAGSDPPQTAELPEVSPWRPGPGELVPACKLAAVRRVEGAGNSPDTAVQVIDAQYGGLLTDTASVLVVTRSWRRTGDRVQAGGATFDVRLSRSGTSWRVTALHPSRPGPPARALSRLARRVLASHRIPLPPAAAADVRSGQIHDSVLTALLTVARSHRPSISVLRPRHPLLGFGTTRPSDRPQGRAFDTWAVDGDAVVDPRTP